MSRRWSTAALSAALAVATLTACGTGPEPGDAVTTEDLESLPGVTEAAAGEFDGNDGEIRQTIAVVHLEPDVSVDDMTRAVEVVSSAPDTDFWAVYLDASGLEPDFAYQTDASGFSGGDVEGLDDPTEAVPVVLGARDAARDVVGEARARMVVEEQGREPTLEVLLPDAGIEATTAVAEALAADAATRPTVISARGNDPQDQTPLEDVVPTASLRSDRGIDQGLVERWADLHAAVERDPVVPTSLTLAEDDGLTVVAAEVHLPTREGVFLPDGTFRRPDEAGWVQPYSIGKEPRDLTPQRWGAALEPVVDGVVDVADDGTTERWTVLLSEASASFEDLVTLESDAPRPRPDRYGRTWSRDAWDRWQARTAGSPSSE
jgi:hypothetical protein